MTEAMVRFATSELGVPRSRLILNASHNHSGPVVEDVLPLYFALTDTHNDKVRTYTARAHTWQQAQRSTANSQPHAATRRTRDATDAICSSGTLTAAGYTDGEVVAFGQVESGARLGGA